MSSHWTLKINPTLFTILKFNSISVKYDLIFILGKQLLDFKEIIKNIKKIENLKHDKEVANILGLKNDNFSQYKTRNTVPIKNIVEYCLTNNLSIDEVLNVKINLKNKFLKNKNTEIKFFDNEDTISIPTKFLKNIELVNIFAYSKNNDEIFLLDSLTNTYTSPSKYLIKNQNNIKQVSYINFENQKFVLLTEKKFQTCTKEDFYNNFTILGKILLEVKINTTN